MILPLIAPEGQLSITSICKDNPNKAYVKAIQDYSAKVTMHMTGLNLAYYLSKIDYFEKDQLLTLRQKYSPSNEDFFGRLHRPIDKIWSASGGSANYYLDESRKKALLDKLKNIKDGYSVRKWMETFWLLPSHYDPMGMTFIEVGDEEAYPVYRSCQDLFSIPPPNGRKYEYIFFSKDDRINAIKKEPNNSGNTYYRVVDDAADYLIMWDGSKATIIDKYSFDNHFGEVPAITNGNKYDPIRKFYISPDDEVIGIADQHLRDRSVLTMFKLHHGFPLKWMYGADCPTCNGTKKVGARNCPSCGGTGKKSKYDVSETIVVPFPKAGDPMPKDYAGFYTPPVESWDKMDETIENYYRDAHYTLWGTHQLEDSDSSQPATATGRFIDVQPVNDKLNKYSDAAEYQESWITDKLGAFYFKSYTGCEVNYGRRFLIESPDVIWEKYVTARTKGSPVSSLNYLYMQWLQAEFRSDSVELGKQTKLMKLEPFLHIAEKESASVIPNPDDVVRKIYFDQWVNQLQPNDLIAKTLDALRVMRDEYLNGIVSTHNATMDQKMTKEVQINGATKQAA